MNWNPKFPKVPIDSDGNWLHYPTNRCAYEDVEPFYATLEIDRLSTGRSAKYLVLRDPESGNEYPMFVSDLINAIRSGAVAGGVLIGKWTVSKRGANFGIKEFK